MFTCFLGVNPDLYGPFWITITLIFTIAISGNLADFLQHDHNSAFHWHYNFHLVSYASTCIILYVSMTPLIIWGVLKYSVDTNDDSNPDLESVRSPSIEYYSVYNLLLIIFRRLTFHHYFLSFASMDILSQFMFQSQFFGLFKSPFFNGCL